MKSNQETKAPFYKQTWFWVSFTLFIFPPLGIFLLFQFFPHLNKNLKIVISVISTIFWLTIVILGVTSTTKTFEINGEKVSISCSEMCSYIDDYGDKEALKILAIIGVKEISLMPTSRDGETVKLTSVDRETDASIDLTLSYSGNTLSSIANTDYPAVIYYSSDENVKTATYPAKAEIENEKEIARQAQEKAESERKKQEEAEKAITYEIIARWDIPNGGETKQILISRANLNDTYMTALGTKLKQDTANDRNAYVQVYTDKRAATLREKLLADTMTKSEEDLYDTHFVGFYVKNGNNGTHYFNIFFNGTEGDKKKTIRY